MVEALAALRDYERACYDIDAYLTAGVEWLRALREVTDSSTTTPQSLAAL